MLPAELICCIPSLFSQKITVHISLLSLLHPAFLQFSMKQPLTWCFIETEVEVHIPLGKKAGKISPSLSKNMYRSHLRSTDIHTGHRHNTEAQASHFFQKLGHGYFGPPRIKYFSLHPILLVHYYILGHPHIFAKSKKRDCRLTQLTLTNVKSSFQKR